MDRVQSIIEHERAAKEPSAEAGRHMWEAAREICEEVTAGKSQKELAMEIGKSQTHVCWMNKTWKLCSAITPLPDFYDIYYSVEVRGASAGTDYGDRSGNQTDDVHTRVSKLAWLAEAIMPDAGSLTAQERGKLCHAIRTLELALGERGRRAA